MGPHAAQPRVEVLVLGQAHLQAAFLARGVQGEYVQDERGAVDDRHRAVHGALEVRLLGGRQLVVEYDQVGLVGPRQFGHFLGLAAADEGAGVRRFEALRGHGYRVGAGGVGQALQLAQRRFERPRAARALDAHEHGTLAGGRLAGARAAGDDGVRFGHGDMLLLCRKG